MRKVMVVLLLLGVMVSAAAGQTGGDRSAQIEQLGRFIEEDTYAIIHVDVQKVNIKAIFDKCVEVGQWEEQSDYYQQFQEFSQKIEQLIYTFRQTGGRGLYAIFSGADFPGFFVLVDTSEEADFSRLSRFIENTNQELNVVDEDEFDQYRSGRFLVMGLAETIGRVKTIKSATRPEVGAALAAADEATVQLLFTPSADQRRVLEEMLPLMYEELETMPVGAIIKGMQWL
ncbi:MAG: hypothetical protein AMJ79_16060, partial [Phycisphaerae bacterium SM23_30]